MERKLRQFFVQIIGKHAKNMQSFPPGLGFFPAESN
jgi:hypothetical protein